MSLNHRSRHRGLTLIEILVGLTMTLIVLGAMMFAFRYASQEISRGRAMMELSNQLRVAQDLLRSDLDGVTVDLRPWAKTAGPNGYFEYIEGYATDKWRIDADLDGFVDPVSTDAIFGDIDDIVAMTVRSKSRPFRGRFNGQVIESNIAEVVWWTSAVDRNGNGVIDFDEPITLRRRVLLIRPDLVSTLTTDPTILTTSSAVEVQEFFLVNDISARLEDLDGDGTVETMVPNSLADLSKRENRFARLNAAAGLAYPFAMQRASLTAFEMTIENMRTVDAATGVFTQLPDLPAQAGDDIVISDITSFDLQVFSPDTPILQSNATIVEPHDVGYLGATGVAGFGAFVDLAYARGPGGAYIPYDPTAPAFSTAPTLQSQLAYVDPATGGNSFVVYDTFSTHYESDGISTDGDVLIDEGTDGIDNDGANGVDDNLERETLPPYPNRVLGVKATIRIVERNSKQVRQTEVISSFVPQ